MRRGSSPSSSRSSSPGTLALPTEFPQNTHVFVEKIGGEVYSGRLSYMAGRPVPRWVFHLNPGANVIESVYVRMPNGDGLWSNIRELERDIDINEGMHPQHRCFILYGNGNILVAYLEQYDELSRHIFGVHRVSVRIPEVDGHFMGVFQRLHSHRPSWLY